jgi:hypothetical protein
VSSQQANQQLIWNENPMLLQKGCVLPPTVNGFGGIVLGEQSQGAAADTNVLVDLNVAVDPHAVVGHNTAIDPNPNGGFIPLFLDEKAFNERNAAREADRKKSDYPYDDLAAQHKILGRLYEAIRNTIDVDDSEKVSAKFANDSIPDAAIHAACWEVMVSLFPKTCLRLVPNTQLDCLPRVAGVWPTHIQVSRHEALK